MLDLIIDSLDKVKEEFKPLYSEKDGKFHLNKELASLVQKAKANSEFQKIVEKQGNEISDLKKKIEAAPDVNDIVKNLIEKSKEAKPAEPKPEANPAPNNETSVLREKLKDVEKQLKSKEETEKKLTVENKLRDEIKRQNGIFEILYPIIKDKVAYQDGEVVVLNEAGAVKYSQKTAQKQTISELLEELKGHTTFKNCFVDKSVNGPQVTPPTHNTDVYNKLPSQMTSDEKIEVITKKGKDYFVKLLQNEPSPTQKQS